MFRKRSKNALSLLDPKAAVWLAEYGEFNFDREAPMPSIEATTFISDLASADVQANSSAVVEELERISTGASGWAIYGAEEAVRAFIPSESDSARHKRMVDERLTFLHSLGRPDIDSRLQFGERTRYYELFPPPP